MTRQALTIRARLAWSGLLVLALFGVNLAVAVWSAAERDTALAELRLTLSRRTVLDTLERDVMARAREAEVARHVELDAAQARILGARLDALSARVAELGPLVAPGDAARFETLAGYCTALRGTWSKDIEAGRGEHRGNTGSADATAVLAASLDLIRSMSANEQHRVEEATANLRTVDRFSSQLGVALYFVSITLAAIVAWWLWVRVARALRTLIDGTRRLGRGELSHRIALSHHDELGEVAQSFNDMSASLGVSMGQAVEARAAAERANRAKGAFLANITHELRTPMTAILGYLDLARDEARTAGLAQVVDDLGEIERASSHMLTLINELLDLAKAESGKMTLHIELFDVAVVVDDVVRAVGPLARAQGNRLEAHVAPGLGSMSGDATKVRQTLYNLLGNAAKFTREGEIVVAVEADHAGQWVTFEVRDTGAGIPADQLDRVFDEFEQGDASVARTFGGTGLGLALARRFCRMMGGDIGVTSQVGRGATFTVRLPREFVGTRPGELAVVTGGAEGVEGAGGAGGAKGAEAASLATA